MREKDIITIKDYLLTHIGEKKTLDEWLIECNSLLPNNRRRTSRELAHAFNVMRGRGYFGIERDRFPTMYTFSPMNTNMQLMVASEVTI